MGQPLGRVSGSVSLVFAVVWAFLGAVKDIAQGGIGMIRRQSGALVIMLCCGALGYAVDKPNEYCFTKPAGDSTGGANCAHKACWQEVGVWFRIIGVQYTKCGVSEAYTCSEGTIKPHCSTKYSYNNQDDCTYHRNSSTVQIYKSSFNNCST